MLKANRAAGLDIGQETAKAVMLERKTDRNGRSVIRTTCQLDCREEGILDAGELRKHLHPWLQEHALDKSELTVGLPQYLCTTEISDFPPGSGLELEKMVDYETRQLAGLSEASFIQSHQLLKPAFGWKNPVLIGICRESVVDEQEAIFSSCQLNLADLSLSGLAMVNAYVDLHPDLAASEQLQLLLDIGAESSTLVVVARQQPLFFSALMFGAKRYTQALAKHMGISEEDAEKAKRQGRWEEEAFAGPFQQTTHRLEAEINNVLGEWRSHSPSQIAAAPIGLVALSGGGAQLPGLAESLGAALSCPGRIIGIPRPEHDGPDPRFLTAYGLALQAAGRAPIPLSLASDSIRWHSRRRQRFACLAAALVCLFLFMSGLITKSYLDLLEDRENFRQQLAELQHCRELIPKLEELKAETRHRETALGPLISKGNRATRFLAAISELAAARDQGDWFIYLADAAAYHAGKSPVAASGPSAPPASAAKRPGSSLFFTQPEAEPALQDSFHRINCADVPAMQSLIVAGYTPLRATHPYKPVREIVQKLNRSPEFEGVDLLPDSDQTGREDIFLGWEALLKGKVEGRFRAFTLKVPFETADIILPSRQKERK